MVEATLYDAGSTSSHLQPDDPESTAREETAETEQKTLNVKRVLSSLSLEELHPGCETLKRASSQSVRQSLQEPMQTWVPRFFRSPHGEPYPKRFRNTVAVLVQDTQRFHISSCKGGKKKFIEAALHYDVHGAQCLDITTPDWRPVAQFTPETASPSAFAEQLKRERLASGCSYHDITTKKDYFHCVWQVENPAQSEFFRRVPRQQRQVTDGMYNDVTIPGPIFEGIGGTTWQAIAYPFGYRSSQREGLVGMAVRYINGPESHVSAGFQISLVDPAKMNYCGLQDTIRDHCKKLNESSKKSNVFKRGKKGWVLRKFTTREQIRKCKRSCLMFVLSFCVYGREQTQFRHRFSKGSADAETAIASHMRRLWNNGNPAGRIRMEAKNGKIFRAHSTVLHLNGGVLGHLAGKITPDNPKAALKFPDLSEAVLKKLLEYCYTLQVSGIHKTPFELLLAAHRYDLKGLQDLAEKDVARYIDLDNVLDLYVWNESIQSAFLANFISLFFAVNYAQIRQQPEFEETLSPAQQIVLDDKYRASSLTAGELSEGGEGFISEDNEEDEDDGDSGMENSQEVFTVRFADSDDGPGRDSFVALNPDQMDDQEEANMVEFGEEPDEFQLDMVQPANLNVIVNQAEVDQAAVIAQLFGDFGGLDNDALDFLMMLM